MLGITLVQGQLLARPDLPLRLEVYGQGGKSLSALISIADYATPIVVAIDLIKNDQQTWDRLLKELDKWHPGAGRFIQMIDTLTSTLVRVRNELANLGQLSTTADGVKTFSLQPSESTLHALGDPADNSASALGAIDKELQTIRPFLSDIDAIFQDFVVPGFDTILGANRTNVNLYTDVAQFSNQLHSTAGALQEIEEQINADVAALQAIATTAKDMTSINRTLRQLPIYGVSVLISENIETMFYVLSGLFATWFTLSLVEVFAPQKRSRYDTERSESIPRSKPGVERPMSSATLGKIWSAGDARHQDHLPKRLRGTLIVQRPNGSNERYPLPPAGQVTIGSGESVDVRLNDSNVSERHVVIRAAKTSYFVEAAQPSLQIYLNGLPISQSRKLNDGDIIRIGGTMLVISLQSTH